jgi:hypothetical protein
VSYTYTPSTWEAEVGEPHVLSQPGQPSEISLKLKKTYYKLSAKYVLLVHQLIPFSTT